MDHLQLKNNLFWVGIEDYDLRTFDIVMHTEYVQVTTRIY